MLRLNPCQGLQLEKPVDGAEQTALFHVNHAGKSPVLDCIVSTISFGFLPFGLHVKDNCNCC